MSPKHFHIQGDGETSILELIAEQNQLSKSEIKSCAQKGAIWLTQSFNGRRRKPERIRRLKRILQTDQQIDFYYNPEILNSTPPEAELIFDAKEYSVWLKPRGMFSQGSKWGDFSALYRWVELYFQTQGENRKSWIVHRLDRATHGLMLLAHSKEMARYFTAQFEAGKVRKSYQANISGYFSKHLTDLDLEQMENVQLIDGNRLRVCIEIDQKPALSEIELIGYHPADHCSRLKIDLYTGRKHQIRRHLAELHSPIIGDRLYGNADPSKPDLPDLQLSAYQLGWTCPLTQAWQTVELPESQLNLLNCISPNL